MNCNKCKKAIPDESRYCMYCGVLLPVEEKPEEPKEIDVDWENRVLCPDGRCTGTINNGVCTECGTAYQGGESK